MCIAVLSSMVPLILLVSTTFYLKVSLHGQHWPTTFHVIKSREVKLCRTMPFLEKRQETREQDSDMTYQVGSVIRIDYRLSSLVREPRAFDTALSQLAVKPPL
jgi:hypothetical protein